MRSYTRDELTMTLIYEAETRRARADESHGDWAVARRRRMVARCAPGRLRLGLNTAARVAAEVRAAEVVVAGPAMRWCFDQWDASSPT